MRHLFGALADATPVRRYVIGSEAIELHLLDLGATAHQLHVSDRNGKRLNVLLGHADARSQYDTSAYLGSTVGRCANRIAGAQFALEGITYQLPANDGPNTLHGGPEGFHRRVWHVAEHSDTTVTFTLDSPDGDQGFPGNLRCAAAYTVEEDTVTVTYTATTDKPTIVNVTNHAYFNLSGENSGSVDSHLLCLNAGNYTPAGPELIPFGVTMDVGGSAMDWRAPTQIGQRLGAQDQQLLWGNGIDHNFVIDGGGMRTAARLYSPDSGVQLVIGTDQQGMQVYSGNQLDGSIMGSGGRRYLRRAGIALETQLYPDAPNQPRFPSAMLDPGQIYKSVTCWKVSPAVE